MTKLKTIILGAGAGAMAVSALALTAYAQEPISLTVVSWGGAYTQSQVRAYHEPYMEENPHVTIINDDGSANALAGLRAQHQAGNVTWDLVDMLPSDAQLACDEGIILPIDHDEMLAAAPDGTPASEDFLPGSLGECFIPQIVYSTVLTFRPDAFPDDAQPSSIADLFDVENFPGRRALQDRPGTNLEWALYADGVDPDDIYDVLRTPEGVDRAFAKLDTIKDHIVFWTEGAQAPQLLADGEVAFATGYNGRMFDAIEVEGMDAEEVAGRFAEHGIYVWAGHYYAVNVMDRLGVLDDGGLVRLGFCHYNTPEEVDRLTAEEAFRIEPAVEGALSWSGATMVFTPDDPSIAGGPDLHPREPIDRLPVALVQIYRHDRQTLTLTPFDQAGDFFVERLKNLLKIETRRNELRDTVQRLELVNLLMSLLE
jgi:putative spermidine/putrescine transport system substrate-binding protein